MRLAARIGIACAVWLAAACATATVAFIAAWVLAGPHASVLPRWLEPVVWLAGYAAVLVVPVLLALVVFRRLRDRGA